MYQSLMHGWGGGGGHLNHWKEREPYSVDSIGLPLESVPTTPLEVLFQENRPGGSILYDKTGGRGADGAAPRRGGGVESTARRGAVLGGLDVGVPPVRPVGSHPIVHARGRFAVAVRGEVVGVAPRHLMVVFEVAVRDHVVEVPLEERHLGQAAKRRHAGVWRA